MDYFKKTNHGFDRDPYYNVLTPNIKPPNKNEEKVTIVYGYLTFN